MASTRLAPKPHWIFEDIMGSLNDIMTSVGEMAAGDVMNLRLCAKLSIFETILKLFGLFGFVLFWLFKLRK